jgi:PAS domain S-box-containing protein
MNAAQENTVYRTLFAANPDALLLVDASGIIVLSNPAASRLLGYTADELRGLPVDALVPDAARHRHAGFRDTYMGAPRPRAMGTQSELVARRADGSEVVVEIALSPLLEHGLPYVVAAVRDVGAYPRVRQALQRARYSECVAEMGRLAVDAREPGALLQCIPPAVCAALGADSAVVFRLGADRQFFRLASGCGAVFDAAPELAVPNRPHTSMGLVTVHRRPVVVHDLAAETRFEPLPEVLAQGMRGAAVVPLSNHGRTIGALAVWTRAPRDFGDEEVRCLEALASLLATTLQRADSEAALQHSQRLESVGQLTGGIAHDFNNLLTVIQGNLQVLEEHPAVVGDGFAPQLVAAAARASRRGAELTGKLLAFSRRQVLLPSRVDVGGLLHSLADMLRRTLDERIRIRVDAAPCTLYCQVDAGQLESALLNTAINARDAMPDGGELCFRAKPCDRLPALAPGESGDGDAREGRFVSIAIADTGSGMSDAVRARAFEPFFTTKEAGRGTGLGLSTAYGFVRQSHGSITLDSAPGEGTTVTLFLPAFDAGEEDAAGPLADHALPAGLPVLLVEDEFEVRTTVRLLLQALGCVVEDCGDAEQALAVLAAGSRPGLVLSDVALGPGLRGTELVRRLQRERPQLPVLLMSGYASNTSDVAAAAPLLRKPFTRAELARAIALVIG